MSKGLVWLFVLEAAVCDGMNQWLLGLRGTSQGNLKRLTQTLVKNPEFTEKLVTTFHLIIEF